LVQKASVDAVTNGVRQAEADGFQHYWLAEHPSGGIDAITVLALAGTQVPDIEWGTAIAGLRHQSARGCASVYRPGTVYTVYGRPTAVLPNHVRARGSRWSCRFGHRRYSGAGPRGDCGYTQGEYALGYFSDPYDHSGTREAIPPEQTVGAAVKSISFGDLPD